MRVMASCAYYRSALEAQKKSLPVMRETTARRNNLAVAIEQLKDYPAEVLFPSRARDSGEILGVENPAAASI